MSDKEKEIINAVLKKIGSAYTVDELDAMQKRAVRVMEEWSAQDADAAMALPQEIKDMQMMAHYSLFSSLANMMSPLIAITMLDMTIESAYNLGKANIPSTKPK